MALSDEPQPIWVVNRFLWTELVKRYPELNDHWPDPTVIPFFPISDASSGMTKWDGNPYFIYNVAHRISHNFYARKKSTFVYSARAGVDEVFALSSAMQKILDRDDDTAQDINDFNLWLKDNMPEVYCPVTFENVSLYQNEPGTPRDSSSTPYVTTQFMVVAEYHWID